MPAANQLSEMTVEVIIYVIVKRFTNRDNPSGVQLSRHFVQLRLSVAAPLPSATAQSGQHVVCKRRECDGKRHKIAS